MLYCLDTNIIIDIFRGDEELKNKIENLMRDHVDFCINPIILCELLKGANLSKNKVSSMQLIQEFLYSVEVLDFTENACRIFGEKYAELARSGKLTQEIDLMIASIALAHESVLITRNVDHFKNIKDLKIITW